MEVRIEPVKVGERKKLSFPKGFLWGTATAAHQVEGNNTNSDWWQWEQNGSATPSGQACDHYRLYQKDFKLARQLHNNAHRLSVEWAKIEPKPGQYSQKALEHYRQALGNLRDLGLKAFVTLHHFTAPAWFQEKGSFEKKANIKHFEDYVRHCCRAFGDLVDAWITINEPYIYLSQSYLIGAWPPQKKSWLATLKVLPNLAQAHKKAYQIIRQEAKGTQVGMAKNLIAFKPLTKNPADKLFCQLLDFVYNHSFYRLTGDSHDFIGINYYTCGYISWENIGMISYFDEERVKRVIEAAPKHEENDLGWQIYPKGLYELALSLSRKHQKPIYITENGLADKKDRRRSQFLKDHLEWIWRAIAKGADIRGYFHWTLMDNFEWSLGYGPKFGLFKTDFKTQKRVPRPSAKLYAKICQQNALEL